MAWVGQFKNQQEPRHLRTRDNFCTQPIKNKLIDKTEELWATSSSTAILVKKTEQSNEILDYALFVWIHFAEFSPFEDHTGTFSTVNGVCLCIKSAALSASIITGALRFPLTIDGITDASATFKWLFPNCFLMKICSSTLAFLNFSVAMKKQAYVKIPHSIDAHCFRIDNSKFIGLSSHFAWTGWMISGSRHRPNKFINLSRYLVISSSDTVGKNDASL